jgi:hypothetical protein
VALPKAVHYDAGLNSVVVERKQDFKSHPVHYPIGHTVCIAGPIRYCGGNSTPADGTQYFGLKILLVDVYSFSI